MNTKALFKKKVLISLASALIVILISGWFYLTFGIESKTAFFTSKSDANFSIVTPQKVHLNQPFKIEIKVDTKQNTINAVGLTINFESQKIQVIGIDTTQSFCQFYPEKRFDNNAGKITLSCGSPNPGFSGTNTLLVIEVLPVKIGSTSIVIDDVSKILKSDGKGSNIVTLFPQETINIQNTL